MLFYKTKSIMDFAIKNPLEAMKIWHDIRKRLADRSCRFMGNLLDLTFEPMVMSRDRFANISEVCHRFSLILEKTLNLMGKVDMSKYLTINPPHIPKHVLVAKPSSKWECTASRFDMIFQDGEVKIFEANTDAICGLGFVDIYNEIVLKHPFYAEHLKDYDIDCDDSMCIQKELLRCVVESFHDFTIKSNKKPSILIAIKSDSPLCDEMLVFKRYMDKNNIRCDMTDPRLVSYVDNKCVHQGNAYDVVFRHNFSFQYFRESTVDDGLYSTFNRLAREDTKTLVLPSFRATLGSDKGLFALYTGPDANEYFSKKEVAFLGRVLPWTRIVNHRKTTDKAGNDIDLLEYAKKNRINLVIKPTIGWGCEGVMIGKETSEEKWNCNIDRIKNKHDYIIQEHIPVAPLDLLLELNGKITSEKRYFSLSPFVFNGKCVSMLARFAQSMVVSTSNGGGCIPVYVGNKRNGAE